MKTNSLKPQLRFPEFDGDWEYKIFRELIKSHKGGASLKPHDFVEKSNFEVIPKKAVTSGGILALDKTKPTYCKELFYNNNSSSVVNSSYLITSLRDLVPSGPNIGYIVKIPLKKNYLLAQGVYGIRINEDELVGNYLTQFSNTKKYRKIIQSLMVGSTQVHIRNTIFFNIEIPFTSLPEQQKIASYLSSIDEKINLLTEKKIELSRYKKAMMQQLFSQQIRFKDENGKAFPDWEEKCLGEIADFNVLKNRTNLILPVLTNSAEFGVIHQEDFFDNQIANDKSLDTYIILNKNEFVYNPRISKFAPYGPININKLEKGLLSPLYSVFKIIDQKVFLVYMELYFKTNKWYKYMAISGNQGARSDRMAVNKQTLYNIPVSIPCLEEQQKIAYFLSAIDASMVKVNEQITQTKSFKKAMLQKMFV